MTTSMAKPGDSQAWFLVDASERTLGRLATRIALVLRGKHKPTFTPHVCMGDKVVVINASNIRVTGKKASDKVYNWHTGYPGGIRSRNFNEMIARDSSRVLIQAVKRMLPKGPLGREMMRNLYVYNGADHKQAAQKPVVDEKLFATTDEVN